MSDTIQDEKELEILETIHAADREDKPVVQRDLAHIVGVSLGMTNAILKRLVKKGLLTIRKVNNRNIHYAVSPEGMKALSEKSYRYFKRTIKNVVYYKEKIERIIEDAKEEGFEKVVLVGESDLDFIVEHVCMHFGLRFVGAAADAFEKPPGKTPREQAFVFYSENIAPDKVSGDGDGAGVTGIKGRCMMREVLL
ncbi:MAG: winged helix-turn-helix transcriptional regulator [Spirochaetia bacterium]